MFMLLINVSLVAIFTLTGLNYFTHFPSNLLCFFYLVRLINHSTLFQMQKPLLVAYNVHYCILRQFAKFLLSLYFQQIPTKIITFNHIILHYSVPGLYTIFHLFYQFTIHSMPICFSSQHLLFPRHDPKNPSVYPANRPIMPRFAPHDHIHLSSIYPTDMGPTLPTFALQHLPHLSTLPTLGTPCPHLPYKSTQHLSALPTWG